MRIFKHFFSHFWPFHPALSKAALQAVTDAVAAGEKTHRAELRFAIEQHVPLLAALKKETPRARAIAAFAHLKVWDTEENNGVLLYVGLADHAVEIVADRGVNAKVSDAEWQAIANAAAARFKAGEWQAGSLEMIEKTHEYLRKHYPGAGTGNELPDAPALV
jgi:uncharacterized membrane protein